MNHLLKHYGFLELYADYTDGNGKRILNSWFASYNFKASLGFHHTKWINQNNFYSSFSRFGFIMKDNSDRKPVDGRFSPTLDGAYHAILFNILSSEIHCCCPIQGWRLMAAYTLTCGWKMKAAITQYGCL